MTTTMTASCLHCGFNLPGTHTGPCPKCGKVGKQGVVVANEVRQILENVQVTKISRVEQLKKRPSALYIALVLFISAALIGITDHQFSWIVILILSALGFSLMPIKEKTIEIIEND